MKTLSDAFAHTLQDVYYAENAIAKALPKVIEAASNAELKKALQNHLTETKDQIATLKKVFKSTGIEAKGEKCDAIEGLIKECEGIIEEAKGATARNAALLGACQAIEHYEIARYGTLREWAKAIDQPDAHDMLTGILDQEKAANYKLTNLAVSGINKA
ncbi:MAG TPA: ferritin-like domain-containing protein [Hyphomicrobiaceae bacterium]|nr:ferritin-like domain-containing protein [Hyphomicrobiaceae bacterium]